MNETNTVPIKIIVVGSINVGKTSLIAKYATGKNPLKTFTTKNASYVDKIKVVNGIKFEIKLWDTAGQEKYKSLTKLFIKDTKIAILVYSIDNEQSFNELDEWLKLVQSANDGNNIIYGIVANKSDLASENTIPDEKGQEYAKKIGADWRLTSAIHDECGIEGFIDDLFIKYHNNNFKLNETGSATGSLSITLSTEKTKVEKKKCCGGTEVESNNDNNKKHKKNDSKKIKE